MDEKETNIRKLPVKKRGRPKSERPEAIDEAHVAYLCKRIDMDDPKQMKEVRINITAPEWLRSLLHQVAADGKSTTKGLILTALEKQGVPTTESALRVMIRASDE